MLKLLVIYGPNLNLLGLRSAHLGQRLTLDKLNRALRRHVRGPDTELKIHQTQDEARASVIVQRQRNRVDGILLVPGPWQYQGHVLRDTLELIKKPVVIAAFETISDSVFQNFRQVTDSDLQKACINALKLLESITEPDK